MSDNKLRELGRRWLESSSVEDEAAYLLERVRAGEMTREQLEVAAYLWPGSSAARLVTGDMLSRPEDFREWVPLLWTRFSEDVSLRAMLALAIYVHPMWWNGMGADGPYRQMTLGCIQALQEWIRSASAAKRKKIVAAGVIFDWMPERDAPAPAVSAGLLARQVVKLPPHSHRYSHKLYRKSVSLALAALNPTVHASPFEIIHKCLLPWALGEGDPVLESDGITLPVAFEGLANPQVS